MPHPGAGCLALVTIAAALLVGWAYGGKAWCQYFCPMAPVQTVITGQRGALGSTAHLGQRSKTSQSTCEPCDPTVRAKRAWPVRRRASISMQSERSGNSSKANAACAGPGIPTRAWC